MIQKKKTFDVRKKGGNLYYAETNHREYEGIANDYFILKRYFKKTKYKKS